MKSRRLLLFRMLMASLLLMGGTAEAAENSKLPEDFFPVYDYHNDWLVYSYQYKNYVPYSQGINESTRSVSLNVDLLKNRRYFLMLHAEKESYLFVEGALQRKLNADQWIRLNVDSLYRRYRKDELLISLYGEEGISGKTALLCNQRKAGQKSILETASSNLINIRPLPISSFGNFTVLSLIIILILNAWIFNTNPLGFIRLINPIEFWKNDPRDPLSKTNKPYSNSVIFFVIIVSLLMSFMLIFFVNRDIVFFSAETILSEESSTLDYLRDFLGLGLIFFILLYGKFILMNLVGSMLNLDKVVDTLFLKIIQSSYFFYAFLFLLALVVSFQGAVWFDAARPYVMIPFLAFYSIRFILLYVVTKAPLTFINLYLFSYLCVIEIIPLIIGIKFAL